MSWCLAFIAQKSVLCETVQYEVMAGHHRNDNEKIICIDPEPFLENISVRNRQQHHFQLQSAQPQYTVDKCRIKVSFADR